MPLIARITFSLIRPTLERGEIVITDRYFDTIRRNNATHKIIIDSKREFFVSDLGQFAYIINKIYGKNLTREFPNIYAVNPAKSNIQQLIKSLDVCEKMRMHNLPSILPLAALSLPSLFIPKAKYLFDLLLGTFSYNFSRVKMVEDGWISIEDLSIGLNACHINLVHCKYGNTGKVVEILLSAIACDKRSLFYSQSKESNIWKPICSIKDILR